MWTNLSYCMELPQGGTHIKHWVPMRVTTFKKYPFSLAFQRDFHRIIPVFQGDYIHNLIPFFQHYGAITQTFDNIYYMQSCLLHNWKCMMYMYIKVAHYPSNS